MSLLQDAIAKIRRETAGRLEQLAQQVEAHDALIFTQPERDAIILDLRVAIEALKELAP